MQAFELPKSISSLAERLQVVQIVWQGIPVQIPKFAVYAVIAEPIFDKIVYRHGRDIGLFNFGRYCIPVLDPFQDNIEPNPNFAIIISHSKGNRFGLYAYPADHLEPNINLPVGHASVSRIIRNYV